MLAILEYIMAEYTYFVAFTITQKTTILLALDNLSNPIVLLFSYILLKEQMGENKIVRSSLIVVVG